MRKIWVIARRELYETYTDRNLLIIMLITPVVLATIIGLALGGATSGDFSAIPLALVNLDEGADNSNFGELYVTLLAPDAATETTFDGTSGDCESAVASDTAATTTTTTTTTTSLSDLIATTLFDNREDAIAAVRRGDFAAAVIIPASFSQELNYTQSDAEIVQSIVEIHADSNRPTSATIVRGVIESITNQVVTGNVAIAATIDTLVARSRRDIIFGINFLIISNLDTVSLDFDCAFDQNFNTITVERQTLTGSRAEFDPLVYFGAANAMFFMLFTAQGGANSILEDRRQGVLQRMVVSPTTRLSILLGKLTGTLVTCIVQLAILFVAFTAVATIFNGELTLIWGGNIPAIIITVLTAALAASGLGALLAALARTVEQANISGTVINIMMAVLGGAFFQIDVIPALRPFQSLSLVYWGTDAFTKLADGRTDIATNILVMLVFGAVLFLIGLFIFNRRLEE